MLKKISIGALIAIIVSFGVVSFKGNLDIFKMKNSNLVGSKNTIEYLVNAAYGEDNGNWIYDRDNDLVIYKNGQVEITFDEKDDRIGDIVKLSINDNDMDIYERKVYKSGLIEIDKYGDNLIKCETNIPRADIDIKTFNIEDYQYDTSLPNGKLSTEGNSIITRFKNSNYLNSDVDINKLYENIKYKIVNTYKNGTLMKVTVDDSHIGNYEFEVFCDTNKDRYYFISILDKENFDKSESEYDIKKDLDIF